MNISVDGKESELTSRDQLFPVIEGLVNGDYYEVIIDGKGESSLFVLANDSSALFMYLRFPGDSGFSSRNPSGDASKLQEFRLSNGQVDEKPETQLIEKGKIKDVILTYNDSGELHDSVDWFED